MNGTWCYVTETNFIPQLIKSALQYELIDEEKGTKIIKSLFLEEERKFPAGSWWSVKSALERQNIFFVFEDTTVYPSGSGEIENSIHLRDYQIDGYNAFFEGKNPQGSKFRMIESISTGGGKTVLAAKAIAVINLPTLFFVHTKDLLIQTKRVLIDLFGEEYVGSAGGGEDTYKNDKGEYKQIIVAMIQAFYYHGKKAGYDIKPQYKEILVRSKLMIADECHHSSSDSWFWIAQECEAPYRLGLSATPWRNDGKDLLLQAATGPVGHKVSSRDLVDMGFLSRPNIKMYNIQTKLDPRFEDTTWHNVYKAGIVFNPHRNAVIAAAAVQNMINNRSVLIIINMKIHGILLWNIINQMIAQKKEEGVAVDSSCCAMFMNSGFDIESRRTCLNLFRTGQLRCIIGTSIYDEGIDLPSVNTVIMAAGGKSDTKVIQRLGRSLRLGDRCLFITANHNCTLLTGEDGKPIRCMELKKNPNSFDSKKVAEKAYWIINETMGNIKTYKADIKEIMGLRPIWEVNSQEILRLWNEIVREGFLSCKDIAETMGGFQERLQDQYNKCKDRINNKTITSEEIKLFRMCAFIIAIDDCISVKCPHKKTKNEVSYIDFYDSCQQHLVEHSICRLKTYEYEEHDPKEGFVDEFKDEKDYTSCVVHNTEGCYIDMDEMFKTYPDYFSTDKEGENIEA
jgi:superfamily II DNA or RNA helicase